MTSCWSWCTSSGWADRYPAQLSGGQRQRMALARALAVEPRVLLLDEPFGALDAHVREELRDWLRRLHDELHVTTVFVTHDQEEAMEVAEQVVVMNQAGGADRLRRARSTTSPANEFVMGFVGPVTQLGGAGPAPARLRAAARPRATARVEAHGRARGARSASRCGWSSRLATAAPLVQSTSAAGRRVLELRAGEIVYARPTRATCPAGRSAS